MVRATFPNVEAVVIPSDILFAFGLTATEKLLYGLLLAASRNGQKHLTFKMSVLALVVGMSDRTISRAFQKLETAGLIHLEEMKEGRNGGVRLRLIQKAAAGIAAAVLALSSPSAAAVDTDWSAAKTSAQVNVNMDYATNGRRKRSKMSKTVSRVATRPRAAIIPIRPGPVVVERIASAGRPAKFLPQFGV